MVTQVLRTADELDAARDHYRDNVIPGDNLKMMDAATGALISSTLRESSPGEGHLVQDFILLDAHGISSSKLISSAKRAYHQFEDSVSSTQPIRTCRGPVQDLASPFSFDRLAMERGRRGDRRKPGLIAAQPPAPNLLL
jgi:hypothetical protein